MSSFGKDIVGFFEEPTTYKRDFCKHPTIQQVSRKTARGDAVDKFTVENRSSDHSKHLQTITAYDTLQQLNYEGRLPFDAMLKPKEIVGTDPRQIFCKRILKDEDLAEVIKTRPRRYVSPAISLDDVEDANTRKLMIEFTYTTTTSRADKEAWSGFRSHELSLPNTVFEKFVDPLALRIELLPDIPAGFKASARKWDSIQERYQIDTTAQLLKNRKNIDYETRLGKLVTEKEKETISNLIKQNKLRLPYDKMPPSYGGFRPQFAFEVPLEVRDSSPFDPNLTVAQAIAARLSASSKS